MLPQARNLPTVRNIAEHVNSRKTTAVGVARNTISKIAAYELVQPQVWISRFSEQEILRAAAAVDDRVQAGEQLPLAGVPFAIKDNIDILGLPTTAGCPEFAFNPNQTASVVQALLDAGAVAIGKTNLDQFATGLNGTRSPYGAPTCVFNSEYISGGSSSGSAVAVAAELVAFSLGTDTAGSGRVPAAFNGLVGMKPTKGRWSTAGLTPACRSLDCITVFTHTVDDARLLDDVIAGFDESDVYSRALSDIPRDLRKIGVPLRHQRLFFGDTEASKFYEHSIRTFESLGVEIVEVDIEVLKKAALLLYAGPWVAERTAAIGDFLETNPDSMDPVVRSILQSGKGISAVDAFNAQYEIAALKRSTDLMWNEIDVLLLPTAPTIYRVTEMHASPVLLNSNLGIYTNFVNLLDMSAIAIPAGYRQNDTGFGVTLIGPAWTDRALMDVASTFLDARTLDRPIVAGQTQQRVKLAVVGAHLAEMPLHWQLTSRSAKFVGAASTSPSYRLFAMNESTPPKPALVHSPDGRAIAVEVYELDFDQFGSFVAEVPSPLAIGTVTLADGTEVKGFVSEPRAIVGAEDITVHGGWKAYVNSKQSR